MRLAGLGLSTRIAVAVSLLFVVAVGAIAFWALVLFEAEKKSELAHQAQAFTSAMADNVDTKLRMVHEALIAVARTVPPGALQDYSESEAFLDRQVALHSLFDNGLFLVTPEGRLVGESPPRPERRGSDVSAREYFHHTLRTRQPYISKPYRSTHKPGQPAVIMTAPVFDPAGKLVGLLYGSLDLLGSNLLAEVAAFRYGRTGYLFLADGRNTMIAHPDPRRVMQPMPAPGQNLLFDRAVDGFEGSGETVNSTGVATLQAVKRIKSTGWILAVSLPLEEFHAPIREARRYFLVSTGAGTLAILGLVWALTRRQMRPLVTMTQQVQAMVVDPAAGQRLTNPSRDEIGVLAAAFNAMLDKLEHLNSDLENRVAERTAELMRALDQAESANRAKSDFLAAMSHDLRTPLNAVLGFSQLLESDTALPLNARHRAQVLEIRRAGAHLLELINDVLDLARVEAGKQPVSLEPVHVATLFDDCLSLMRPLAQERQVVLPAAAPERCDCWVTADRTRLKQVLLNLLSNAVKYNRTGGCVQLACATDPLDEGQVRISVSDTGQGLDPAQRDRLFQAFDRLGADAGAIQGAGIGLVLSKRLAELMNGRIGLDSEPGAGSTFWVRLARAQALPAAATTAEPAPAAQGEKALSPGTRTVLYIEDNPVNAALMDSLLEREPGVKMVHAALPEVGLEIARSQLPAVILLDIQLPGIDGYEVLRQLRADESTRHIPVIAISASAMQGDVQRGLAAGFREYLTKPLDVWRVLAVLRQALGA